MEDFLGLGPTLQLTVSEEYIKGVISCSPSLGLKLALNPPKDQLSFSIVAIVIRKETDTLLTISDLISTGSTERVLFLQGDAKSRTLEVGDLLLILNPLVDGVKRLTVNSTRCLFVVGKIPDIATCTHTDSCCKPVIKARDGTLCWQHAINASAEGNVRADTAGGFLVSTRKSQITKIVGTAMATKRPVQAEDPQKRAKETFDAKKRTVVWLQERTRNQKTKRDQLMRAAMTATPAVGENGSAAGGNHTAGNQSDVLVVMNGDEELEIEFEEDPRMKAPAMLGQLVAPMSAAALKSATEDSAIKGAEEPATKKPKLNKDENNGPKLTLPTFSSDSEDDLLAGNELLTFNEDEMEQIRAKYR